MPLRALIYLLVALCAFTSPTFAQSGSSPSSQAKNQPEVEELPTAAPAEEPEELLVTEYGHGIFLTGNQAFVDEMARILDEFATYPTGAAILRELGQTGRATVFQEYDGAYGQVETFNASDWREAYLDANGEPGEGTDALVSWNPGYVLEGFNDVIVMGHELIHAIDYHRGTLNGTEITEGPNAGTRLLELRAIGTGDYAQEPLSENRLRLEWNQRNPNALVPLARTGHGATDFLDDGTCNHHSCNHPIDPVAIRGGLIQGLEPLHVEGE